MISSRNAIRITRDHIFHLEDYNNIATTVYILFYKENSDFIEYISFAKDKYTGSNFAIIPYNVSKEYYEYKIEFSIDLTNKEYKKPYLEIYTNLDYNNYLKNAFIINKANKIKYTNQDISLIDYLDTKSPYIFDYSTCNHLTDKASNINTGGVLFNIYAASGIMQLVIDCNFNMASRLIYNGSVFIDWKTISPLNNISNINFYSTSTIPSDATNLSNYTAKFVYNYYFGDTSNIQDLPSGINTNVGGTLINFKGCGGQPDATLQVLIDINNYEIFMRMLTNTNTQFKPWKKIVSLKSQESQSVNNYTSEVVYYAFGDSITQGSYSYYDDQGNYHSVVDKGKGYPDQIAVINGYKKYVNLGWSGGGWLQSYNSVAEAGWITSLNENDLSDATLVTIMPYINDISLSPMGTIDSPASERSIAGIFKWGINKILDQAPLCTIVIIATPGMKNNTAKRNLNNLIRDIAAIYAIPFIDLQADNCISNTKYRDGYPDGTHPSLEEFKQIARYLAPKLPR